MSGDQKNILWSLYNDKNHNPRKGTEMYSIASCSTLIRSSDKNHNPRKGTEICHYLRYMQLFQL